MTFTPEKIRVYKRRAQRGFIHMLLLVFAVLGLTMWGVSELQHQAKEKQQTIELSTEQVLANAKQALINYAMLPPEKIESANIPGRYNAYSNNLLDRVPFRYLSLPCPDVAGNHTDTSLTAGDVNFDGVSDIIRNPCAEVEFGGYAVSGSRFGRLPWRDDRTVEGSAFTYTRGLGSDFRNGHGQRLWYAVSRNIADTETPLNPHALLRATTGWMTAVEIVDSGGTPTQVTLSDRVAAFIISPGQASIPGRISEESLYGGAGVPPAAVPDNIIASYLNPLTYGSYNATSEVVVINNSNDPAADKIEFLTIDELVGYNSVGEDILENAPENIYDVLSGTGAFTGPINLLQEHLNRFGYLPEPAMFDETNINNRERGRGPVGGQIVTITVSYTTDEYEVVSISMATVSVRFTISVTLYHGQAVDITPEPQPYAGTIQFMGNEDDCVNGMPSGSFTCQWAYPAHDTGGGAPVPGPHDIQSVGEDDCQTTYLGGPFECSIAWSYLAPVVQIYSTMTLTLGGVTYTDEIPVNQGARVKASDVTAAFRVQNLPPVYIGGGARVVIYDDGEGMTAPYADALARLDTNLNRAGLTPERLAYLRDGSHYTDPLSTLGGFTDGFLKPDPNYIDQRNPITIDPDTEIEFVAGQQVELILSEGIYGYFLTDSLVDIITLPDDTNDNVEKLPPFAVKAYYPPGTRITLASDGMIARLPSNFSLPSGSFYDPLSGEWSVGGGTEIPIEIVASEREFVYFESMPEGFPVDVGDMGLFPIEKGIVREDKEGDEVDLPDDSNAITRLVSPTHFRTGDEDLLVIPYPPPGRPASNMTNQEIVTAFELPQNSRFLAPVGTRVIYPTGAKFNTGDAFVFPDESFLHLAPGAVLEVEVDAATDVYPYGGEIGSDGMHTITFVHGALVEMKGEVYPDPQSDELLDEAQKSFDVEIRTDDGDIEGDDLHTGDVVRPFLNRRFIGIPSRQVLSGGAAAIFTSDSYVRAGFLKRARHHRIPMPQEHPGYIVPEGDLLLPSAYNEPRVFDQIFGITEDNKFEVLSTGTGVSLNFTVSLYFDEDTQFLIPPNRPVSIRRSTITDDVKSIQAVDRVVLPRNVAIYDADSNPELSNFSLHFTGGAPKLIVAQERISLTLAEVATQEYEIYTVSVNTTVTPPVTTTLTTTVTYRRIMENRLALFPDRDMYVFRGGGASLIAAGSIVDLYDGVVYAPTGMQRIPRVAEDLAVRSKGSAQLYLEEGIKLAADRPDLEKRFIAGQYTLIKRESPHMNVNYKLITGAKSDGRVERVTEITLPEKTFIQLPVGVDLKFISDNVGDSSNVTLADYERFGEGAVAVVQEGEQVIMDYLKMTLSVTVSLGTNVTLTNYVPATEVVSGPAYFSLNDGGGGAAAIVNHASYLKGNPVYLLSDSAYLHEADTHEYDLQLVLGQIPAAARLDIYGNLEQRADSGFYSDLLPPDSRQFMQDFPLIYAVAPECRRVSTVPGTDCAEEFNSGLEFELREGEEYVLEEPMELESAALITSAYPGVEIAVWELKIGEQHDPSSSPSRNVEAIIINERTGEVEYLGGGADPDLNDKLVIKVNGNNRQTELRTYMFQSENIFDSDDIDTYSYAAVDGYMTIFVGGYASNPATALGGATIAVDTTIQIGYGSKMHGVQAREKIFGDYTRATLRLHRGSGASYYSDVNLKNFAYTGRGEAVMLVSLSSDAYNVDIYGGRYSSATVGQISRVQSGAVDANIGREYGRQEPIVYVPEGTSLAMRQGYLWPGYLPQYAAFVIEQNPDAMRNVYQKRIIDYYTRRYDRHFEDNNRGYNIHRGVVTRYTDNDGRTVTVVMSQYQNTLTVVSTVTVYPAGENTVTISVVVPDGATTAISITLSVFTLAEPFINTITVETPTNLITTTDVYEVNLDNASTRVLYNLTNVYITTGLFPSPRLNLRIQSTVRSINSWGSGLERPESIDHLSRTYWQQSEDTYGYYNGSVYFGYGASRTTRTNATRYKYQDWYVDTGVDATFDDHIVPSGVVARGEQLFNVNNLEGGYDDQLTEIQEPAYNNHYQDNLYTPYTHPNPDRFAPSYESFAVLHQGLLPGETDDGHTRNTDHLTIAVAVRLPNGARHVVNAHWRPVVVEENFNVTVDGYIRLNGPSSSPLLDSADAPNAVADRFLRTVAPKVCRPASDVLSVSDNIRCVFDPNHCRRKELRDVVNRGCLHSAMLPTEWLGRYNRSADPAVPGDNDKPEAGYIDNFTCNGEAVRATLIVPHTDMAGAGPKHGAWPSTSLGHARPNAMQSLDANNSAAPIFSNGSTYTVFNTSPSPSYAPILTGPPNGYNEEPLYFTPNMGDVNPVYYTTYSPDYYRDFDADTTVRVTSHTDMAFYMDSAYFSDADLAFSQMPQQTLVFGEGFKIHGPSALVPPFAARTWEASEAVYAERSNLIRALMPDMPPMNVVYGSRFGDCRNTDIATNDCPTMYKNQHWFPIAAGALTFDGLQVRFVDVDDNPGSDAIQLVFPEPQRELIDVDGNTVTIYAGSIIEPRKNRIQLARPLPYGGSNQYELIPNDDNLIAVVDVSPVRYAVNNEVRHGSPQQLDAGIFNMAPSRAVKVSDGSETDCLVEPLGFQRPGPIFNFDMRSVADAQPVLRVPAPLSYSNETSRAIDPDDIDSPICQAFAQSKIGYADNQRTRCGEHRYQGANHRSKISPFWYRFGVPHYEYTVAIAHGGYNYAASFHGYTEAWDLENPSATDPPNSEDEMNHWAQRFDFYLNQAPNDLGIRFRGRNWTYEPIRHDGSFNRGFLANDTGLELLAGYHSGQNIFTVTSVYRQTGRAFSFNNATSTLHLADLNYGTAYVGDHPPSSSQDVPLRNPLSYQWQVAGDHFIPIGAASIDFNKERGRSDAGEYGQFSHLFGFVTVGMNVKTTGDEFTALRLAHQINIPRTATILVGSYTPHAYPGDANNYFTFPPGSEALVLNADMNSWLSAHPYLALQKQGMSVFMMSATVTLSTMAISADNDGYSKIDVSGKHVVHYQRAEPSQHMEPLSSVPIHTNVWLRVPTGGLLYNRSTGHGINLTPNSLVNPVIGTYLVARAPYLGADTPLENQYLTDSVAQTDVHIAPPVLTIPAGARIVAGELGGIITNVKAAVFFSLTPLSSVGCPTGVLDIKDGMDGTPIEIDQFREAVDQNRYEEGDRKFGAGHPCAWLDDEENMDGDRLYVYRGRRRYDDALRLRPASNDRTYLLGGKLRLNTTI